MSVEVLLGSSGVTDSRLGQAKLNILSGRDAIVSMICKKTTPSQREDFEIILLYMGQQEIVPLRDISVADFSGKIETALLNLARKHRDARAGGRSRGPRYYRPSPAQQIPNTRIGK